MSATQTVSEVPKGYIQNAIGDLVRLENVKPIDLDRHHMTIMLIEKARQQQQALMEFKNTVMDQIAQFMTQSFEKYGTKPGGKKGNITFHTYDGTLKVQFAVAESISFDERLQAARALINECILEWSKGANSRIKTLVDQAFQTDKEGNISTGRILSLRKLDMKDERWDRAMQAIADSIQVTDTKHYVRFYSRETSDSEFKAISLDIAKL